MKITNFIKPFIATATISPFVYMVASCSCGSTTKDIKILYTNDIHATLDNEETKLGFVSLAGYRDQLEFDGYKTLLVDSGDFGQGSAYGTIGQGKYIIEAMNACKYNLTIPGNHEFDWGMDRFNEIRSELKCEMISTNFYNYDPIEQKETSRVLNDVKTFDINGKKIGFVGLSTPQTLTASNPNSFKNADGKYIYSFLSFNSPVMYYAAIQESINYLKTINTDYIIGLSHLGYLDGDYGVKETIAHTSGFNAVLDGHSHTYLPLEKVKDSNGVDVCLTQTGTGFQSFGEMTIKSNNELEFKLIDSSDAYSSKVDAVVKKIKSNIDGSLKTVLGKTDFDLVIYDQTTKERLVRKQETNLGDFAADCIAWATQEDENELPIAFIGGGCVRKDLLKGDLTYKDVLEVFPFNNIFVKAKISGQTLLDALEFSVYKLDTASAESGGFLQVSSRLKYSADLTIETPVIADASGNFVSIDSSKPRRVTSATVDDVAIDATKEYIVASIDYTLVNLGDGYTLFKDAEYIYPKTQLSDWVCLAEFTANSINNGTINNYKEVQNRITLKRA